MTSASLRAGLAMAKRWSFLFAILLISSFPRRTDAQTYVYRVFGNDDGLRNMAILSMAEDRSGYLWAGTLSGLYRYNGDKWERFGTKAGLPDSLVVSLAVTPDGSLWAGTGRGVAVWRRGRFQPVDFGLPIGLTVHSRLAVEPRSGTLWVATTHGLATIAPSEAAKIQPVAHFVDNAPRIKLNCVGFGAYRIVLFG